jgi:hypothetical protein
MILTGISHMYWITRLSSIHDAFIFIFIIAMIIMVPTGIIILSVSDNKGDQTCVKNVKKYFITAVVIAVLSGVGLVFVPKTNEALLIYGVGTTINYVDNNETIKQLPDKAVQALDKYLDSLNKDSESKNSHN